MSHQSKAIWHVNNSYAHELKWTIIREVLNSYHDYLWHDGTVHRNRWCSAKVGEQGCFGSEEEAQAFLKSWLIKENIQELEKELKDLKDQQEKEKRENETFVLAGINVDKLYKRRVVIKNTQKLRDEVNASYNKDEYLFINAGGFITHSLTPESYGKLVEEIRAKKSDWKINEIGVS